MHGLLLWSQCFINPEGNQDRIIGQQIGKALPGFQVGPFFVLDMVTCRKFGACPSFSRSPEQTSDWLRREEDIRLSHERI